MDAAKADDLQTVLGLVESGRAVTRGELAKAMNLRSTGISELVGELLGKRLLQENTRPAVKRGRPVAYLSVNPYRFCFIYLHIANRRIVARALDSAGRVLAETMAAPEATCSNEEMADTLLRLAREMQARLPDASTLSAVVCSLSGLLDVPRGLWCFTSRWPALRDFDVNKALAPLGTDVVLIRNLDAELTGRLTEEPGSAERSVLLLHWGFGIGAAYATSNDVVNLRRGRFCEIGHWELGNAQGRPCNCGHKDCLETVAALWSIWPKLREKFPDLPFDEMGLSAVARDVPLLESPAMEEALAQVLRIIKNLCRLLFPEEIVLTGPFFHNVEIFNRFSEGIWKAPLLGSIDQMRVTLGSSSAHYELVGAIGDRVQQARVALIARP